MKSKPGTSSTVHHDLEAGLPQARYSQSLKTPSTATATSIATDNPQATEDQVLLTSSSTAKTNLAPASNNQPLQAPAMDRGAPRPAGTVQTTRQRSDEIPTAGASLIIAVPAMVALIILLFGYDAKICTSTGGWMLFTLFSTSISSGLTAALISSCSDPDTKKLIPLVAIFFWTLLCGLFAPACVRQDISPQSVTGGNTTISTAY